MAAWELSPAASLLSVQAAGGPGPVLTLLCHAGLALLCCLAHSP